MLRIEDILRKVQQDNMCQIHMMTKKCFVAEETQMELYSLSFEGLCCAGGPGV
jgi:hypothetical protein